MIEHRYYIERYDWSVTAYYAVNGYFTDEIMSNLIEIGCNGSMLKKAKKNLEDNNLNTGLTYSNYRKRETVMVVALTSNSKEFHRSLFHEIRHLQSHIASAYGISEKSEEVCYLIDEIVDKVHDKCSHLICKCCRKKDN